MRLSNKLLSQGYVKELLKSSLRKFYGRYEDLTKQYEVPLSRMLHDILDDDHIQWHPTLIRHYTNFLPLLIWTLLPNLTFYLIVHGFHRTYATGAVCQQRTLTPPDTWSCPILDLHYVLCRDHWYSQSYISPIHVPVPWLEYLPNLISLLNIGFHRTFATGFARQQWTLTPPETWSCPTLGIACVLMSRPISPELVLSPDFRISNTPHYNSFASNTYERKYFRISL